MVAWLKARGRSVALAPGLVAAAALAALAIFAFGPVHTRAAFPGQNGKIAFGRNKTGIPKIYAMNADGSQVHRLTTGTGYGDSDPAFSPNGTKIAFQRSKKGTPPGIYVMYANGSHQHRLARNGEDPAYSATSGKIAFERGTPEIGPLYVMNADGSHQHRLARHGFTPDFSPNGKKIAFVRLDNLTAAEHIFVMKADGSQVHRLAGTFGGVSPAFSPDGKQIAFSGVNLNIWVMNADGSHKRQLTNSGEDDSPNWGVLTCNPLPC